MRLILLILLSSISILSFSQSAPKNLMKMAKAGDVEAQIKLGDWYINAKCENFLELGSKWYAKAVEENNSSEAAMKLYRLCNEYNADDETTLGWLEEAALLGDSNAQYFLSSELEGDCKKAKFWLQTAAQNGNLDACYEYGLKTLCGSAVVPNTDIIIDECYVRNEKEGLNWIKAAANNGHSRALALYGLINWCGTSDTPPNRSEAYPMLWRFLQTEDDFWMGMRSLAVCIIGIGKYYGIDTPLDYDLAFKMLNSTGDYEKSIELTRVFIDNMLLGLSLNSFFPENLNIDGLVAETLAKCHRFGRGTPVDETKAQEWTEIAAKYGNDNASQIIKLIESDKTH